MAINYQSSFNSGELSRKMDGRSDLDVYRNGCSFLENFYVLPQGGVERRTGTEFVAETASTVSGEKSARLIPFTFSSDEAYVCEFGDGYIKILDSDGEVETTSSTWVAPTPAEIEIDVLSASSGTFTVTVNDVTSGLIAYNATAGDVVTALGAMTPAYTVTVDLTSSVYTITFGASAELVAPPSLSGDVSSIVGGSPAVTVTSGIQSEYINGELIDDGAGNYYRCILDHNASALPDDITASYWETRTATDLGIILVVPYAEADLRNLKYHQRYDLLYISHPDYPLATVKRTALTPAFDFEDVNFDYPPLLEDNDSEISILPSDTTGSITLTASESFFNADMVGGQFIIRHDLGLGSSIDVGLSDGQISQIVEVDSTEDFTATWAGTIESVVSGGTGRARVETSPRGAGIWSTVAGASTGINYSSTAGSDIDVRIVCTHRKGRAGITVDAQNHVTSPSPAPTAYHVSDELDVSFSTWSSYTGGTWNGRVIIERKVANDIWREFLNLGDTTNITENNFSYSSSSKEGKNTFVRLKFTPQAGTGGLEYSLRSDTSTRDGLVEITAYNSATSVDATVVSDMLRGDETLNWAEGAFSTYRGNPVDVKFHENRMWLASAKEGEPSVIYASVSGDYYNFITGSESDLAIKRLPDNPEEIEWMVGRKTLFVGTEGGAMSIIPSDERELITASNIKTDGQSVFGCSYVAPVLANDVVLYLQKNGLKIRELVYNWEEENFRSNDITILNDEVLATGVKEMFLQKQPDQLVWCIKDNGDVGVLTYERGQEVVGWSRVAMDGEVISGCSIPTALGEDEVWLVVKRLGSYLIEKFHPRADLNWYLDSAVSYNLDGVNGVVSADSVTVDVTTFRVTVNKANHGLSNGDKIKLSNVTEYESLNGNIFTVADSVANVSFVLKTEDGSEYYDASFHEDVSLTLSGGYYGNGVYTKSTDTKQGKYVWDGDLTLSIEYTGTDWLILGLPFGIPNGWYSITSSADFPPTSGYSIEDGQSPIPTLTYSVPTITLDYELVANSLSGLDHLEGETVQVVGDGNFVEEAVYQTWATATEYAVGDIVYETTTYYKCNTAHTASALFATDSAYWDTHSTTAPAGTIFTTDYYNTLLVGLGYDSTLRTMPVEPILTQRLSSSRVKGAVKATVKFYSTIGAKIGEKDKQLSLSPALTTNDEAGEPLELKTGETKFFISSDWEREKIIEIKQDLPYPMTVLSMTLWAEAKGG